MNPTASSRLRRWLAAPVIVAGLLLLGLVAWPNLGKYLAGANDFANFYAAGKLAGTGQLYQPEAVARELDRLPILTRAPLHHFVRPPFLAAFLWPLSRLPYGAAHWLWQGLALGALAIFLWRWPAGSPSARIGAAAWSYPLLMCVMSGEDVGFLLLWLALARGLLQREKPVAAGAVLSLVSAKFHLFWLLPLLVAGQRRWRLGAGLLAGGAVLLALCFAVEGAAWPLAYLQAALQPGAHPLLTMMPNLNGLVSVLGLASWWQWVLAALLAGCVWRIIRTRDFDTALAAVLVGGLLVSYHCYVIDFALCLPACLTRLARPGGLFSRTLALLLLTPAPYLLPLGPYPPGVPLVPVMAALLVVSLALERPDGPSPAPARPILER